MAEVGPVRFRKQRLSDERYEAAGVFDVDGDGHLDVVSGGWWYAGPDFEQRHPICDVAFDGSYYDDFSVIAMDVDGDGLLDVVTGGWSGETLRWRRNPGRPGAPWEEHVIAHVGNIETTRAWDVDGDGELEIVPNTPNGPLRSFKLVGPGRFEETVHRKGPSGHGLGFGDGCAELIVGAAHGYGLDWWKREEGGWVRHPIDPFNSQYHDLAWADLDGDGQCELVTGKRFRAHEDDDPGAHDPFGLCYFKWTGEGFVKQVIDYGPEPAGQGAGIHFAVADLDGSGRPDIVVAGKDGLTLYRNLGLAA